MSVCRQETNHRWRCKNFQKFWIILYVDVQAYIKDTCNMVSTFSVIVKPNLFPTITYNLIFYQKQIGNEGLQLKYNCPCR